MGTFQTNKRTKRFLSGWVLLKTETAMRRVTRSKKKEQEM
jgi:hypothetical protein